MQITPRQEKFAREYVKTGNKSEAYRRAYPKSLKWKPETVNRRAFEALKNGKVCAMVQKLQEDAAKKFEVTVESIVQELADTIEKAKKAKQFSPAISGIVKKAELFGLFEKHQKQGAPAVNIRLTPQDEKL